MQADGTIVAAAAQENRRAVLARARRLRAVRRDPRRRAARRAQRALSARDARSCPAEQYVERFREKVDGATDVGMVYGRLCVVPGEKTFLREAILTVFREAPCRPEEIPALEAPGLHRLAPRGVSRADRQPGGQGAALAGRDERWASRSGPLLLAQSAAQRGGRGLSGAERRSHRHPARVLRAARSSSPRSCERAATIIPRHDVRPAERHDPQRARGRRHVPALRRPGHVRARDAVQPAAHRGGRRSHGRP